MAAATITEVLNEWAHTPYIEIVQLTASDGETYASKKFQTILGAIATSNDDNDADLQVTLSGSIATIRYDGQTDKLVTLMLFGRQ